jgi:putative acetyltransferase
MIVIRPERAADHEAIDTVTRAAFAAHEHSCHVEQDIIVALRHAGALSLSLVAQVDGRVVGQVAFSPVSIRRSKPAARAAASCSGNPAATSASVSGISRA